MGEPRYAHVQIPQDHEFFDEDFPTWFVRGLAKRAIAAGFYPLTHGGTTHCMSGPKGSSYSNIGMLIQCDPVIMQGITELFSRELGVSLVFESMTKAEANNLAFVRVDGGVDELRDHWPRFAPILPAPAMGSVTLEQVMEMAEAAAVTQAAEVPPLTPQEVVKLRALLAGQ